MPALIEKEEITEPMRKALQHHIIRERERRMREEKEAEKDYERRAKIEEERRKKEEEDSLTLEQLKDHLSSLHKKHEGLKAEKHQLFTQLKKVLQEEERKKQKLKEQSDLSAAAHGHYSRSIPNMGSYQIMQGGHYPAHPMFNLAMSGQSSPHGHPSLRHPLNQSHQTSPVAHQGLKRPHSPASPQPSPIQMYQRSTMSSGSHLPGTPQHAKYDHSFPGHPSHFSITGVTNPPVSQSILHGTPSRHISVLHTGAASPSGRPAGQRSPYSSISLIKQLEIASQKSGFSEDPGNSLTPPRGRNMIRMLPQNSLLSQQVAQSPRSRSGSPGRYSMHPDKSHSPFHTTTNPQPGSRLGLHNMDYFIPK